MNGLAKVRLNRPEKLNALNPGICEELEDAFIDCEQDVAVKVLLILGNEKAFAAGADIGSMAEGDVRSAYELTDQPRRVRSGWRICQSPQLRG